MKKRIISALLVVIMLIGMVPTMASVVKAFPAAKELPPLSGDQAMDTANIALSQRGYTYSGGTVYGNWWNTVRKSDYDYTKEPWCAMFACWCATQAGAGINMAYDKHSAKAASLLSWLENNAEADTSFSSNPAPGDFIFFSNSKGGSVAHVAIVVDFDKSTKTITFVGGNQGGKVSLETTTWSDSGRYYEQYVKGYGRPNYAASHNHKEYYQGVGVCSFKDCGYVFDWESTFDPSTAGVYEIVKSFTPRVDKPYSDANQADFSTVKGDKVEVLGSYTNAYEKKWYIYAAQSGQCYYVHESYLKYVSAPKAKFNVTLMANGGTCSTSTISVPEGNAIGTLPTPSFATMDFKGWYTKPYAGTKVTSSTVPTGDMTIWAHYTYSQKLNFDPNGGAFPKPILTSSINGVNISRTENMLVAFNKGGSKPGTNKYGTEVAVNAAGKVTAVRKYESETQLTVPEGGFILSGHQDGSTFVGKIIALNEAYVHLNYETGVIKVFDSYAGYLAEAKRGEKSTQLGVLPVPTREGYVFRGWCDSDGRMVDYYSSFAGINYIAKWDKKNNLSPQASIEYNGHRYELYDHNVTWTEAKALCEAMGGYLVTITSAAEQAKIVSLIKSGSRGLYRIGATDIAREGTWKWVNGETFSYSNWDKGLPEPNGKEKENYANIIAIENPPNKQVGEWIDDVNTAYGDFYDLSNSGFICEFDQAGCNHRYTKIVYDPTCTTEGYTLYICEYCGDWYYDDFVAVLAHEYIYSVDQKPTIEKYGYLVGECERCGESTYEIVPALNKSDYTYQVVEQPTTEKTGTGRYAWNVTDFGLYFFYVTLDKLPAQPAIIYGDTDGNGKIQTNDAKLVLQYVVKMPATLNLDAADVDGNGKIQTNDAKLILQYVVKIITQFPAEAK